jgi:hypothetical protein
MFLADDERGGLVVGRKHGWLQWVSGCLRYRYDYTPACVCRKLFLVMGPRGGHKLRL